MIRRDQFILGLAAAPRIRLSDAHRSAAARKRRICVQFDAADHRHVKLAPREWLAYLFGHVDAPGSQIDTILWDVALGDTYAVYPSKLLPSSHDVQLTEWRRGGFEWVPAMLAECRKRKIEAFWHHRFSEVDILPEGGLMMDKLSPLKATHPDWVIKSWWWQGLWNAASPGLREHKVQVLREVAETLDIDGIQIDFARHMPCLPPGRQWEMRDHVTEFLRMMRRMLVEVERAKNHPLLLSVKVPETLRGCRIDGLDVASWAREDLIDMLTLGSRTATVDVEDFRKAVGPRIRLSPSIDDHHATDGYRFPPIEVFRGMATNWLEQGADSVTTFNWSASPGKPSSDTHGLAYREIGTLETMQGKPLVFFVERRGGYPWSEGYFNQNADLPLPARLANHGGTSMFPLRIHARAISKARLSIALFQARETDRLQVEFNRRPIGEPAAEDWKDPQIFSPKPQPNSGGTGDYQIDPNQKLRRLSFDLPPSLIRRGTNEVSIRVKERSIYRIGEDIQVEKIEAAVTP